jgi:Arc/MetJ-type ribon-helix-helix transcriptional regulator
MATHENLTQYENSAIVGVLPNQTRAKSQGFDKVDEEPIAVPLFAARWAIPYMPTVEVSLPDKVESEITQLVERGEYLNREQAVEDLLARGIKAHTVTESEEDDTYEDTFGQVVDDQQDPAMQGEGAEGGPSF